MLKKRKNKKILKAYCSYPLFPYPLLPSPYRSFFPSFLIKSTILTTKAAKRKEQYAQLLSLAAHRILQKRVHLFVFDYINRVSKKQKNSCYLTILLFFRIFYKSCYTFNYIKKSGIKNCIKYNLYPNP